MKLVVSEIFHSIQGEGPNVGKPAVFLRLGGCNLNCIWCDSRFAMTNDQYPMTNEQVLKKIKQYPCKHLVITGGEPMLQQEKLKPLLKKLKGYFIEVETNGSIPLNKGFEQTLPAGRQVNCSPKLSSSGNKPYPLKIRPSKKVVYKFVVGANARSLDCARDDRSRLPELEEIKRFTKQYKIPRSSVWLMPEGVTREVILRRSKTLIEICKKEGYNFSPRLHVMLYGNRRGV